MTQLRLKITASAMLITTLTACGGGGAGGAQPVVKPVPRSYEPLSSSANVTSPIGGTALQMNASTGALALVRGSGSLTHNTGHTTLDDGTHALTDPDGFDTNNSLSGGASSILIDGNDHFTGTYEYVTPYTLSYTENSTTYDVSGTFGILTDVQDIPETGTVTYNGEAVGILVAGSNGYELTDGNASVTARFGAGTVDVTLSDFTAIDALTNAATTAPIDTISATGMNITGNGFSGGVVSTTSAGAAVDVLGDDASTSAQGDFFGFDQAIDAPDEVAATILGEGDSGKLAVTLIAD